LAAETNFGDLGTGAPLRGQIFAIACRTQPQPCCDIALDNLLQIPKQEKARLKQPGF
jgi:hypothetical protein